VINEHFVKKDFCPTCGKSIDSAYDIASKKAKPLPGDISICVGCEEILEFDQNLTLIKCDQTKLNKFEKENLFRLIHLLREGKKIYVIKDKYS